MAHASQLTEAAGPEQAAQWLLARGALTASAATLIASHSSRNSSTWEFRIETAAGPEFIMVKRRLHATSAARQSLLNEFAALQDLGKRVSAAELNLAMPIQVDANALLMAMTKVSGQSLSSLLRRDANCVLGLLYQRRMRQLGIWVGEWLARFQRQTQAPPILHRDDDLAPQLEHSVEKCLRQGFPADAIRRYASAVRGSSGMLQGTPLPASAVHGDFLPQNILLDGTRVGVIDFASYTACGTSFRDVGYLLAYLYVLGSSTNYSRSAMRAFSGGFLEALSIEPESAPLALYTGWALLRIVGDYEPSKQGLRESWRRNRLTGVLARLGKQIESIGLKRA